MPPSRRTSHAQSTPSDTFTPPPTRRTRATIQTSTTFSTPDPLFPTDQPATRPSTSLAPHYTMAPTVPSPFTGTLEASLDAIHAWAQHYARLPNVQAIVTTLLADVRPDTNWAVLLDQACETEDHQKYARYVIMELLFLVTRTLLPEQITENRAALARLYETKKHIAIRLLLRYDMLREWKMESGMYYRDYPVTVASVPPDERSTGSAAAAAQPPPLVPAAYPEKYPFRRALLPNVIPTLVAAPPGGYTTYGVRERMKHHVTDLDGYLMLRDEEVEGWSLGFLKVKTCFALLKWQWIRKSNGILEDMEVHGWEGLGGKADECEWIADDVKRMGAGNNIKKEVKMLEQG